MSRFYIVHKDELVTLLTSSLALDLLMDYSGSEVLSTEDWDSLREEATEELLNYERCK